MDDARVHEALNELAAKPRMHRPCGTAPSAASPTAATVAPD